jgi:hypothetical protein
VAGRSFHHGRFVQRLRHAATAVPGVTVRGATVRRLLNGAPPRQRSPPAAGHARLALDAPAPAKQRDALLALDAPTMAAALACRGERGGVLHASSACGSRARRWCAGEGQEWEEGQAVSGVQYKDAEGKLRSAKGYLTICCDGMYSTFRKQVSEAPGGWEGGA